MTVCIRELVLFITCQRAPQSNFTYAVTDERSTEPYRMAKRANMDPLPANKGRLRAPRYNELNCCDPLEVLFHTSHSYMALCRYQMACQSHTLFDLAFTLPDCAWPSKNAWWWWWRLPSVHLCGLLAIDDVVRWCFFTNPDSAVYSEAPVVHHRLSWLTVCRQHESTLSVRTVSV